MDASGVNVQKGFLWIARKSMKGSGLKQTDFKQGVIRFLQGLYIN